MERTCLHDGKRHPWGWLLSFFLLGFIQGAAQSAEPCGPALYQHPLFLGRGGYAVVYRVQKTNPTGPDQPDQEVALKFLLKNDSESITSFLREYVLLLRMSSVRYSHVIRVNGIVQSWKAANWGGDLKGHLFFEMEYITGAESLDYRLDQPGDLDFKFVVRVSIRILKAIERMRQQGIAHRDIKPGNVLVAVMGNQIKLRIIDFGLARKTSGDPLDKLNTDTIPGTPYYIAPEIITGTHLGDTQSDLFSLGMTMYHLLAGRGRFPFESLPISMILDAIVRSELPRLTEVVSGIPVDLANVVHTLIKTDRTERYRDPKDVFRDLVRVYRGLRIKKQ